MNFRIQIAACLKDKSNKQKLLNLISLPGLIHPHSLSLLQLPYNLALFVFKLSYEPLKEKKYRPIFIELAWQSTSDSL
jgi:hypothetical protein